MNLKFTDIAIIGLAGRFPEAKDIDEFCANLRSGIDSVRPITTKRKKDTSLDPQFNSQIFGFLEDVDKFDYEFFDILPAEAQNMDPHQRLLMEVVQEIIDSSAYSADYFDATRTALFIGDTTQTYYQLAKEFDATLLTGNLSAATAGRIARAFNFHGNAVMVDTACSSSLVALHMACNELILGEADFAFVCGASLSLFPQEKKDDPFGIDAADGKARAFAASANGTALGEAVCGVLLKPMDRALKDKDIIYAVIKGSAVNQDAKRSSSLTAPSSNAQMEVLQLAWEKSRIDPATITYIEAHGTGTKLGDPIEVEALVQAFSKHTSKKQFCALSAVKTNIGHTDTAAGLSGVIKAIVSLMTKQLFPSLHFDEPNPFIDFMDSPLYVNAELQPWEISENDHRRAGVSSFGISGTNCHVVLEEAPLQSSDTLSPANPTSFLFLFSAKNENSLRANIAATVEFIEKSSDLNLGDLSYTLAIGRKHYDRRFACVANNKIKLLQSLREFLINVESFPPATTDTWFLFSGDAHLSDKMIDVLRKSFFTFDEAYTACLNDHKGPISIRYQRFAFQYALFTFLNKIGVGSKKILGTGTGKLVIQCIKDEKTISQAIGEIPTVIEENKDLDGKIAVFIREKLGNDIVDLFELGGEGEISKTIARQQNTGSQNIVMLDEVATDQALLSWIGKAYQNHKKINWSILFNGCDTKRIRIPAYQFTARRCWINDDHIKEKRVYEWFYKTTWIPQALRESGSPGTKECYLVFMDDATLGKVFIDKLTSLGIRTIVVQSGEAFQKHSDESYCVCGHHEKDFEQLAADLRATKIGITGIVSIISAEIVDGHSDIDVSLNRTLYPEFFLCKSFSDYLARRDFQFVQLTVDAHAINSDFIRPEMHMRFAMMKAVLSEYVFLKVTSVDFSRNELMDTVDNVVEEIFSDEAVRFVAYRKGERFVQKMSSLDLSNHVRSELSYQKGGTYLITGGAFGIGSEVARMIASRSNCKFVVLGRSELPPQNLWPALTSDQVSSSTFERVQNLRSLIEMGSSVEYFACDISNSAELRVVFNAVRAKYSGIHGVVHAAGSPGDRNPLMQLSFGELVDTMRPKVQGTVNLHDVLKGFDIDFFFVFSSLNTLVPQRYTIDYTIANAFLDAYVIANKHHYRSIKSFNWGAWGEVGAGERIDISSAANQASVLRAWSTEEGMMAYNIGATLTADNVLIGDIDRQAFFNTPFFLGEAQRSNDESIALSTDVGLSIEERIHKIWREVLGKKDLALHDNFFDVGGHSLIGARLINRITKELKVELTFRDIVTNPTIYALSRYVESRSQSGQGSFEMIPSVPEAPHYELSHAQKRLWIQDNIGENQTNYIIPNATVIDESINEKAFVKALEVLVSRHEILRTTFKVVDGIPRQVINDSNKGFTLSCIDMQNDERRNDVIQEMAINEAMLPFNLSQGPLLRAKLIRVEQSKYIFLYSLHHIVSDGWSMDVILREFFLLYDAFSKGKPHMLTPLRIQYKDFAAWQNRRLQNSALDPSGAYWRNKLENASFSISLATDSPRLQDKIQIHVNVLTVTLSDSIKKNLKSYAQKNGVSNFVVLLSALKIVLFNNSGQNDIIVGSPVAGRRHPELENQIGFYLNMLPVRTSLGTDQRSADYINKMQQTMLDAFEHQDYPFDLMIEQFGLKREKGRQHFFDVEVDYHQFDHLQLDNRINFQNLKVNSFKTDVENHAEGKFDLAFLFEESKTSIDVHLTYNKDLFKAASAKKMLNHFEIALFQLLHDPLIRISEILSILKDADNETSRMQKQTLKQSREQSLAKLITTKN